MVPLFVTNVVIKFPMNKNLICIVGPTAIGKTKLSIAIAKHYNTEIISVDSRQFYKELTIGTAVPSTAELNEVKHHFIQNKSVMDPFNVGDFEIEAISLINNYFIKNTTFVAVGGSGLYMDAIVKGLDEFPKTDGEVRKKLTVEMVTNGIASLQEKLRILDVVSYKKIDLNNPHRLIRALEICLESGKPYSSFLKAIKKERAFKSITIGLTADRNIIYNRINERVDKMLENGLLEEVKSVLPYKKKNALNTVGYKELFDYLNGECTYDEAVENIKKNSRRFAKRQLTWFNKNKGTIWFDYKTPNQTIIKALDEKLKITS